MAATRDPTSVYHSGDKDGFLDHDAGLLPEAMVVKDSVMQPPK